MRLQICYSYYLIKPIFMTCSFKLVTICADINPICWRLAEQTHMLDDFFFLTDRHWIKGRNFHWNCARTFGYQNWFLRNLRLAWPSSIIEFLKRTQLTALDILIDLILPKWTHNIDRILYRLWTKLFFCFDTLFNFLKSFPQKVFLILTLWICSCKINH